MRILQVLLIMALAGGASAQGTKSDPSTEREIDDARSLLEDPPAGRARTSFTDRYLDYKRGLLEEHGLLYGVVPTVMLQQGTQGGDDDFTVNEQVHLFAQWTPGEAVPGGSLVVYYMHVGQVTSTTGVDFLGSLGTSFALSDSATNVDALRALYWRQELFDDTVRLFVGQGEVAKNDNSCKYSCDDTTSFISAPLSTNPARTLPGAGMGAGIELEPWEPLEIAFAAQDARGDGRLHFGRVFDTGEIAYAGEVIWRARPRGLGDGTYRVTGFHTDAIASTGQPSSTGWQVAVEQDVGNVGLFVRGGSTHGRTSSVRAYVSGGGVWKGPSFGEADDWLGVGGSWVRPSDSSRSDEGILELYYRYQLTPLVQVTPDVMLVFPSRGGDAEAVFNLRAQIAF